MLNSHPTTLEDAIQNVKWAEYSHKLVYGRSNRPAYPNRSGRQAVYDPNDRAVRPNTSIRQAAYAEYYESDDEDEKALPQVRQASRGDNRRPQFGDNPSKTGSNQQQSSKPSRLSALESSATARFEEMQLSIDRLREDLKKDITEILKIMKETRHCPLSPSPGACF